VAQDYKWFLKYRKKINNSLEKLPFYKNIATSRTWWLMPVIPAIWEAGRSRFEASLGKKVCETPS
jgi:hypothetical protein